MAIYDNDGMTDYEIAKLYDNDGATDYQIGKVYDNDGTAEHLIYSAELVFYDNGMVIPWDKIVTGTYQTVANQGTRIFLCAYNDGACACMWKADVTGFNTLEVTTSIGESRSGRHRISATPHPVRYPSNPTWDEGTSSYRGVSTGELWGTSGVQTLDVSKLSGIHYFSVNAHAQVKGAGGNQYINGYYDLYVHKFRLY